MSVLSKLLKRFIGTARKEVGIIIYSVVIGLAAWFLISITIYPTTPKTIHNIPVVVELEGTTAEEKGLEVISKNWEETVVSVTIKGNRSQIGSLTANDLVARVKAENVNTAGKYELDIEVVSKEGIEFSVESQSPRSINLSFDSIGKKEFTNITASMPNVTTVDGMTKDMDHIEVTPGSITVTGPSSALELIDHFVVLIPDKRELNETYTFTNCKEFHAYDASNKEIDLSGFGYDETSFSVTVPVKVQKELDLKLQLVNCPSGFNTDFLLDRLMLNPGSIIVTSDNKELINQSFKELTIRLSDITLDYNQRLEISTDGLGSEATTDVGFVDVELNAEGLTSKELVVKGSDIVLLGKPAGYDFSLQTKSITITAIGPAADIEMLTAADIIATVDLSTQTITDSSFNQNVSISFPKFKNVWSVNVNNVWIIAEPNSAEYE